MRFGSRGPRKFLRPSPCRSSRIRHRKCIDQEGLERRRTGTRQPFTFVSGSAIWNAGGGVVKANLVPRVFVPYCACWLDETAGQGERRRWVWGWVKAGTWETLKTQVPVLWRKVDPGKRVTLPDESTIYIVSVYMRKKLIRPSQELITALMRALIVSPPPYKLTRPAGLAKVQSVYMD